jgi:DNA-binding transcriptional regulator YiaG
MTAETERETKPEMWVPKIGWGDRIRVIRRGLDLSQDQFAAMLGIGKQRLSAWESGANRPTDAVEMAQLIEARTGVPATWMLGLDASGGAHRGGLTTGRRFSCSSGRIRTRLHHPDRVSVA